MTLSLGGSVAVYAENGLTRESQDPPLLFGGDEVSMVGYVFRVIAALILIIGLIILLIKFLSKKNSWIAKNRTLRVLGGVQVGQHKAVQLIKLGDTLYLVGVGDSIQLLDKVDDPEVVMRLLEEMELEHQWQAPRWEWLNKIVKPGNGSNRTSDQNVIDASGNKNVQTAFMQQLQQAMKRSQGLDDVINEDGQDGKKR